jgi:hypothetical protein
MANTFIKLGGVELTSTQSSLNFTSIPQTYTDLIIVCSLRTTNSGDFGVPIFQFNNLGTNTSMSHRGLINESGSVSGGTNNEGLVIRRCPGGNAPADYFGSATIWISNYASSTTVKYFQGFYASPRNQASGSAIGINGCAWSDTSAISAINIKDNNGNSFAQYSSAYLYGVSNA